MAPHTHFDIFAILSAKLDLCLKFLQGIFIPTFLPQNSTKSQALFCTVLPLPLAFFRYLWIPNIPASSFPSLQARKITTLPLCRPPPWTSECTTTPFIIYSCLHLSISTHCSHSVTQATPSTWVFFKVKFGRARKISQNFAPPTSECVFPEPVFLPHGKESEAVENTVVMPIPASCLVLCL